LNLRGSVNSRVKPSMFIAVKLDRWQRAGWIVCALDAATIIARFIA
jgi:hypothetical protein